MIYIMKVEPVMMGLRKVRSEVTTVRKEGVVLNGTEKVNILTVDMASCGFLYPCHRRKCLRILL